MTQMKGRRGTGSGSRTLQALAADWLACCTPGFGGWYHRPGWPEGEAAKGEAKQSKHTDLSPAASSHCKSKPVISPVWRRKPLITIVGCCYRPPDFTWHLPAATVAVFNSHQVHLGIEHRHGRSQHCWRRHQGATQ